MVGDPKDEPAPADEKAVKDGTAPGIAGEPENKDVQEDGLSWSA